MDTTLVVKNQRMGAVSSKQIPKTVLITGAGTGIGKESAIKLLENGHKVVATTETEAQAEALKLELKSFGDAADVFKLDISVAKDRELICNYDLDVLVNNGAVAQSGSLAEVDIDVVRQTFEVNLFSTLELSQLAIRNMLKRDDNKGGTIVFVSSLAGRIPKPFLMPYAMTKFALSAGVAGLREEMKFLNKGIKIAIVEPGAYGTGFNQRMAATQFVWMEEEGSIFSKEQIAALKANLEKEFRMLELTSLSSIVDKVVQAVEATNPALRYAAPRLQALYVKFMRSWCGV